MNGSLRVLSVAVMLSMLDPLAAHAWNMRGGGGARTFVVPHGAPHAQQPRSFNQAPPPHQQPHQPQQAHSATPPQHNDSHHNGGGDDHHNGGDDHHNGGGDDHHDGGDDHHDGGGDDHHNGGDDHHDDDHHHDDHDDWYHPWAAAAVVGATTATILAIGTRVTTVPVDCVSVTANGVLYQHCGPTWYQPQYVGSNVQYIVVTSPW